VVVGMAVLNNAAQQGAHRQADHETYNQPEGLPHVLPISSDFFFVFGTKTERFSEKPYYRRTEWTLKPAQRA
jgi:hypothetical protein